jgi:hypothetical protein
MVANGVTASAGMRWGGGALLGIFEPAAVTLIQFSRIV